MIKVVAKVDGHDAIVSLKHPKQDSASASILSLLGMPRDPDWLARANCFDGPACRLLMNAFLTKH